MDEEVRKTPETNIDYKDKYIRAYADYQNLKKDTERQRKLMRANLIKDFGRSFLPLYDDLRRAHLTNQDDEGIELIYKKCISALCELGITLYSGYGDKFNSEEFNAIDIVNLEGVEDDVITECFRSGAKYDNSIIRYADVQVNKIKKTN